MDRRKELRTIIAQERMDIEYFKAYIEFCQLYYNLPNLNLSYKQAAHDLMKTEDFDEHYEALLEAYMEMQDELNKSKEA
jgi:hypothetical protein